MKLFVDTTSGSLFSTKRGPSFSIDVHYMDTVMMLKQRIEKSQGIPVFKQTLFLQGKVLQDDHYYLQNLLPYYSSRLLLSISPEDNPNENNNDQVPQTEQSPSNPVLEFANNQGWPVIVKLFVDTKSGSSFSIDVDFWDTVLMMKQKIEKSQGIPVFKQTLFLKGKVLQDNHYYLQSQFPHNFSRLFLSISPDDNPNQNNNDQVPQTEQSPSNPVHEFANNQDWPVMSNNDQVHKTVKEFFGIQDLMEGTNKQVLHQTEQSPLPSNQRYRPLQMITARRTNNGYSLDELLAPRELPPVTVGSRRNRDQVVQTEKSSPSDSVKEILGISDSPVTKKMKTSPTNLTVFVQPYEESRRIFVVKINANYNVKVLRKELVKMQEKGELNLPEEGYHFIVRDKTLNETQSFMWNLVADGDTIEVVRDQA